jgi:hypothetical protein
LNADEIRNAFSRHIWPGDLVHVVRGPAPQ